MFDAVTLFERLCIEAEDREMFSCGNALCLKPINVKGSHCKFGMEGILLLTTTSRTISHDAFLS